MFETKKSILFIAKSKIKIVNVTLGRRPKEDIIAILDWTPDTLPDVLLKHKKNIKDPARILLAEDFVYTVNLALTSSSMSREDVKRKAQELIPENLDQTLWDFKEIESLKKIQVIALAKTMFGFISSSIVKAGIRIEAIEPLSLALARLSVKEGNAKVFVYINDGEILLTLAQKGIVIGTKRLATIDLEAINQFSEQFSIVAKDVIFCGNTSGVDLTKFSREAGSRSARENLNLNFQIKNISPFISSAQKEDIKGKDEEVLNLGLLTSSSFWQAQSTDGARPESPSAIRDAGQASMTRNVKRNKFLRITLVVVLLIITATVTGFLFFQAQRKTDQTTPKPTQTKPKPPETITTPIATQSAKVDFSSYTIRVLNGSGKEGEAGKLEGILKENGFNVTEIGNADNSNYVKTEIHHKEEVPNEVILALDKIINTLYDFSISANLEEGAGTDILIIIGSGIK